MPGPRISRRIKVPEESQAIEGYGCICGYRTDDLKNLRTHLLASGRTEKGMHKSMGRINLSSGDVVLPPWNERTQEEKDMTRIAVRKDNGAKGSYTAASNKITENLSEASEIKFVPRVYTATLSPILQTAFVAAQRVWKWRADMPFINFLDTCIYNYFKEHGITLAAFVVDDSLLDGDNGDNDNGVHGSPEEPIQDPPVEKALMPEEAAQHSTEAISLIQDIDKYNKDKERFFNQARVIP